MYSVFKASNFVCASFGSPFALLQVADYIKGCLNRNDFDHQLIGDANSHPYAAGDFLSDENDSIHDADPRDQTLEHPCVELKKVLSGGTFYYSVDFDLTNQLQSRYDIVQPGVLHMLRLVQGIQRLNL